MNDLRFGLRQLVKQPGFAAAAILTLALGIGANTAVFSVLNGYLFKPLPYPHGKQLVRVDESEPKSDLTYGNMSMPIYLRLHNRINAFTESALYSHHGFDVESGGQAALVEGMYVTPSVFKVLGIKPLLGRTFAPAATQPGRDRELVLSYGFWQQRFGGKSVLGTTITIAGNAYQVIGVMPKGFAFTDRSAKFWAPMPITAKDRSINNIFKFSPDMIARYRSGASAAAASRALLDISKKAGPHAIQEAKTGAVTFTLTPWREMMLGNKSQTALLLQAAALFLLLITCVNVANLLLSRILSRTHEFALRAALGASRLRLARQLLVEGLYLVVPGGIAGVALGWLSLHVFTGSAIGPGEAIFNIQPDWRVAGFAVAIIVLTGVIVSILPLWHLGGVDVQDMLQEGGRVAGGHRARRVRQVLVVIELGLATVLLVGSGLLLRSLIRAQTVDPGYQLQHVLVAGLSVPSNEYKNSAARVGLYRDIQQRVQALPGVKTVGVTNVLPFSHSYNISSFKVRGRKLRNKPTTYIQTINDRFFRSLHIPLLRGRGFDARDTAKGRPVVVIDQKLAHTAFPHKNPMGQAIRAAGGWRTVIGVVPTVKTYSLTKPVERGTAYVPLAQVEPHRSIGLTIESSIPPAMLARSLRQSIHQLDRTLVLSGISPLQDRVSQTLDQRKATMHLVLVFGTIALALAFVGVYGVLSYAVRQRRAECGVRLALGAEPRDLLWLFIKDGLQLLGIGLGVGLILAVIFGFVLSSRLFGVAPFDPVTMIGATVIMALITIAACYLPARRAAKLDPAIAIMEQ
jgi:putative ABC transport system permease protein